MLANGTSYVFFVVAAANEEMGEVKVYAQRGVKIKKAPRRVL